MNSFELEISNTDSTIDIRKLDRRRDELQRERDDLEEAAVPCDEDVGDQATLAQVALAEWDTGDNGKELAILTKVLAEVEGYGDGLRGTMIHEDHFLEYITDLLTESGSIPANIPAGVSVVVDADHFKSDYTEIDYGGETYLVRA